MDEVYRLDLLAVGEGPVPTYFSREARAFAATLRESGFALLDMSRGKEGSSDGAASCVASLVGPARCFFSAPPASKSRFSVGGAEEQGYYAEPVEHFTARLGGSNAEDAPDFQSKAKIALAHTVADSRDVLTALGWSLSPTHPTQFTDLLDLRPLPPGVSSSSHIRVLNYGQESSLSEHVDRGLLTFVVHRPGTSSGSTFEVFDQRENKWRCVPSGAVVVLVGHTLEAASAGVFRATRYRVVTVAEVSVAGGSDPRLSLAFQIRGRPEAIIMPELVPLGIRRNEEVSRASVKDLMERFSLLHASVAGHGEARAISSRGVGSGGSEVGPPSQAPGDARGARGSDQPPSKRTRASIDDNLITITVRCEVGVETFYRMRRTESIGKLMRYYAQQQGESIYDLRFLYHGDRLNESTSPEDVGLRLGDVIHVFRPQCGD